MKRMICVFLCIMLILSLAACNAGTDESKEALSSSAETVEKTTAASEGRLMAGVYTASAMGKNEQVEIQVEVDEEKLLSVVVLNHQETPGVSDPALTQLPDEIVTYQSVGLDAVTGCTITSEAVLTAVADCLLQAGADLAQWSQPVEKKAGDAKELTADVIVIGAGAAGLSAAASAAENGASVIVIEAAAACGGTTSLSAGFIAAVYDENNRTMSLSEEQVDAYNKYLEYDAADFGDYAADLEILQGQIREYLSSGENYFFDSTERLMIDHYTATKKTDLDGVETTADYALCRAAFSNTMTVVEWLMDNGMTWGDEYMSIRSLSPQAFGGGGPGVIACLKDMAEKAGAEILYNTRGEHLIQDGETVAGVQAVMSDGTMVTLHANKGVVIATGGFASNTAMCEEYNRTSTGVTANTASDNCPTNVGDGILMAQELGANLIDMQFIQLLTRSINGYSAGSAVASSQLLVDGNGNRFVNEAAGSGPILNAASALPDGVYYAVGSDAMAEVLTQEKLDQMIAQGWAYQADTLEEVCDKAGLDYEAVSATIDRFHAYVDNNEDTDFSREAFNGKVEGDTYIIAALSTCWHHTMGGIQIDVDAQVLNTEGAVIDGLYAAGEVCGGIEAGARQSGDNLEEIIYFGMTAGRNAALR